MSQRRFQCENL